MVESFLDTNPALGRLTQEISQLTIEPISSSSPLGKEKANKLKELKLLMKTITTALTKLGNTEDITNSDIVYCFTVCLDAAKAASLSIKENRELWTKITDFMRSLGNWFLDVCHEFQDKWNKEKTPQKPHFFNENIKSIQDTEKDLKIAEDHMKELIKKSWDELMGEGEVEKEEEKEPENETSTSRSTSSEKPQQGEGIGGDGSSAGPDTSDTGEEETPTSTPPH